MMMKPVTHKIITISIIITVCITISWLSLWSVSSVLKWQHMLWQARYILLAWRLFLYTAMVSVWIFLQPHILQQNPFDDDRLRKIAGGSFLLLAISESSNILQWGNGI